MLDTRKIGSYISSLRKEADLTQVELADQLNVSHQAVSKWERGESIPDIGSLLDLSKLFGKSVDQLLNGSHHVSRGRAGSLLTHISENHPDEAAEMINRGEADADGLVDAAPLLKASELRHVANALNENQLTFDHVVELAPFLDEETLDRLLQKVEKPEWGFEDVKALAPFLRIETLISVVNSIEEEPEFKDIIRLAPFLEEHVEPFIEKADITDLSWEDVTALAPFIRPKTLVRLVDEAINEPLNVQQLIEIAPFLDRHIDGYLEKIDVEKLRWKEIIALAPFVEEKTLSGFVGALKDSPAPQQLAEVAPFLASDSLEDLLKRVKKEDLTPDLLSSIAPFLDKETLSQLMTQLLEKS